MMKEFSFRFEDAKGTFAIEIKVAARNKTSAVKKVNAIGLRTDHKLVGGAFKCRQFKKLKPA